MNVAVIGASDKTDRYGYIVLKMLKEEGHRAFPVHPKIRSIDGEKVYSSISQIQEPVHTVTLYVSREISSRIADELVAKGPKRLIFNPGSENPELQARAGDEGIETLNACTLTLLRTRQFE